MQILNTLYLNLVFPISSQCRGDVVKTTEMEGMVYGEVDLEFTGGVRGQIPVSEQSAMLVLLL